MPTIREKGAKPPVVPLTHPAEGEEFQ